MLEVWVKIRISCPYTVNKSNMEDLKKTRIRRKCWIALTKDRISIFWRTTNSAKQVSQPNDTWKMLHQVSTTARKGFWILKPEIPSSKCHWADCRIPKTPRLILNLSSTRNTKSSITRKAIVKATKAQRLWMVIRNNGLKIITSPRRRPRRGRCSNRWGSASQRWRISISLTSRIVRMFSSPSRSSISVLTDSGRNATRSGIRKTKRAVEVLQLLLLSATRSISWRRYLSRLMLLLGTALIWTAAGTWTRASMSTTRSIQRIWRSFILSCKEFNYSVTSCTINLRPRSQHLCGWTSDRRIQKFLERCASKNSGLKILHNGSIVIFRISISGFLSMTRWPMLAKMDSQ